MTLEKAVITNLSTNEEIKALFNPREYVIEKSAQWKEHHAYGNDAPFVQFTGGQRRKLAMELFFDTYEERSDVREHIKKIESLMMINPKEHKPPLCMFSWGKLKFKCMLEEMSARYTMFLNDGVPVRSIVSVIFKEYGQPEKDGAGSASASQKKMPKTRTVKQGDTLQSISAAEYGDSGRWRKIADSNNIGDPMNIKPGQTLKIPD